MSELHFSGIKSYSYRIKTLKTLFKILMGQKFREKHLWKIFWNLKMNITIHLPMKICPILLLKTGQDKLWNATISTVIANAVHYLPDIIHLSAKCRKSLIL